MPTLFQPLISLLVLGVIFYVLYWLITQIPLPPPFQVAAKVILAIAAVIAVVNYLLPYVK